MDDVVNDLARRLGRAEAGQLELVRELLDTAAWLEERAGVLERLASSYRMDQRFEVGAEVARLRGRAVLLRTVTRPGGV